MNKKLKKLDARGVSHLIVPLLVVVGVGAIGATVALKASHADAAIPDLHCSAAFYPANGTTLSPGVSHNVYFVETFTNAGGGKTAESYHYPGRMAFGNHGNTGLVDISDFTVGSSSRTGVTFRSSSLYSSNPSNPYTLVYDVSKAVPGLEHGQSFTVSTLTHAKVDRKSSTGEAWYQIRAAYEDGASARTPHLCSDSSHNDGVATYYLN